MNYSLTSCRKIGDYWQKIITTWFGTDRTVDTGALTWLESWHNRMKVLDATGRNVGETKFLGFTENQGSGSTNDGLIGVGEFVVLSKIGNDTPKTVMFRIEGFSLGNVTSLIDANCYRLIGSHSYESTNYLISATIDLHKGGENADVSV